MRNDERRVHARIETYIQCKVVSKSRSHLVRLRGLSMDGASILGPNGMADVGDTLAIELDELRSGRPLSAEVVRTEGEGLKLRYGVRLKLADAEQREEVSHLIQLLTETKGTSSREHPRIYHYVLIRYRTQEQFEAQMNNFSRGGLGFECETPAKLGERILVEVEVGERNERIELPCIVASVRAASSARGPNLFQVGVRFDALTSDQLRAVDEMIRALTAGQVR